jgi:zinc protease
MESPSPLSRIERHRLDNGLDVVLHRDHRWPLVAVNLWYHVGSKNEQPGRTGFAHLFEHMLFQGSQHIGPNEHFRYVQQVGGVANGSTWYDRTNYYETVPANQLDLALWLESDRMGFFLPALTSETLETQRQVVMNERRQRVDNQPYGRALERLHEILFPLPHPYHWPVIGYMDDIAAATLDEVAAFFSTWYTPDNAVLTVAGDIEPAAALERIRHWFGDLPPYDGPAADGSHARFTPEAPGPLPAERSEAARDELTDDVRLPRLYVGTRVPAYGDDDWYVADLLSTLWSAGKSSALHRELVYERELAQSVVSFVLPTEQEAMLGVIATARSGVSAEDLETALVGEMSRLRTEEPAEEDLDKARRRLLREHFHEVERLDRRADLLSNHTTFFGDPSSAARESDRYRAVTPRAVRALAEEALDPRRLATVVVHPENGSGR